MGPLIVQTDGSILLECDHPEAEQARQAIVPFCELIKSPDYIHTYQVTPLSIWNAAAQGHRAESLLATLRNYSRYPLPESIQRMILLESRKYGKLSLESHDDGVIELVGEPETLQQVWLLAQLEEIQIKALADRVQFDQRHRGEVKRRLVRAGYPVIDRIGFVQGEPLQAHFMGDLRHYQQEAVESLFKQDFSAGVVVLPCGAGKTIVGIAALVKAASHTLILTPNVMSLAQWKRELLSKTDVTEDDIGEYTSFSKTIRPITLTTYQMLTYRKEDQYPHFAKLACHAWGFVIYDEVHLLPAPAFRMTAELQSARRLGLTATLVREDGMEKEVFSLIGPKLYEAPWKWIEQEGFIAETYCYEIAVNLDETTRSQYIQAPERRKYRIAAENDRKSRIIKALLRRHQQDRILIIGQYVDQLTRLAKELQLPLITGKTHVSDREKLFEQFRRNDLNVLLVSKVANVAIDLPDANVAIQISGSFGSRQEEAQRVGRILRPNNTFEPSRFYTVVSKDTKEMEKSVHRQLFLIEQGYRYECLDEQDIFQEGDDLDEVKPLPQLL